MKTLLTEFPSKTFATHKFITVKRLQRKIDDIVEWSTDDNLPVEENKKLLLNKNTV